MKRLSEARLSPGRLAEGVSRATGRSFLHGLLLLVALCALASCTALPLQDPAIRKADVLLLGEVHDNPAAHTQRFALLRSRVEAGWRPAIAMEQFDHERQAALDEAMRHCSDADCVVKAAGDKGWAWSFYLPVISLAQRYGLPLVAANLSRRDAVRVMREGYAARLDAQTIARARLDQPLPADIVDAQRREIIEGHCNKLPASMIDGMLRAQVARDVWMAQSLAPHASRGVVLLAGNGHVRKDVGVPRWLSLPGVKVVSVGFVEPGQEASTQVFDFTQVVPPHERGDPCEGI